MAKQRRMDCIAPLAQYTHTRGTSATGTLMLAKLANISERRKYSAQSILRRAAAYVGHVAEGNSDGRGHDFVP
jgi:hypothetical protein